MVKVDGYTAPPVAGHRGSTTIPVKWSVSTGEDGKRYFEGIAYNAAIRGERKRVTCSDKTWYGEDDDTFYWDEAIRWTVDELASMDFRGVPIRMMHEDESDLPAVGQVAHSYVDSHGNLRIVAELPGRTPLERRAIELMDSGLCEEISIGYPLIRDRETHQVYHSTVDEFSLVDLAHFRGCRVGLKASGNKEDKQTTGARTVYRIVRAGKSADTMSAAPSSTEAAAAAAAASPTTNNNSAASVDPEVAKAIATLRARLEETNAALKEKEAALVEKEKILGVYTEADKKKKAEHIEKELPRAQEIIADLRQIVKDQGVDQPLSEEWANYQLAPLLDTEPLAREVAAVTVSCSRGYRKMKAENAALQARLDAAEKELSSARAEVALAGEMDRTERRDTKARNRNALMQPSAPASDQQQQQPQREMPAWAARWQLPPQTETRSVAARMTTPASTAAAPAAQAPSYTAPISAPVPAAKLPAVMSPAPPANLAPLSAIGALFPNSMSNNPSTREMFKYVLDRVPETDISKGAYYHRSGETLRAPGTVNQ